MLFILTVDASISMNLKYGQVRFEDRENQKQLSLLTLTDSSKVFSFFSLHQSLPLEIHQMDKDVNHLLSLKLKQFADIISDWYRFALFTLYLRVYLSAVNLALDHIRHDIDKLFRGLTIEFLYEAFSLFFSLAFGILHSLDHGGSVIW